MLSTAAWRRAWLPRDRLERLCKVPRLSVNEKNSFRMPRSDFGLVVDERSAHRLTLRDWLHSIVQALDADNAVLRPLDAPRGYSIASFIVRYYDVFQSETQQKPELTHSSI